MIRMYGFWRSSAAFRVRIALNLKGLVYTEQMIDLDAGEQHAPEYRAINPAGSVPTVFVDNGPPLTQSLAILEYLEDTHPEPPLLPPDPLGRQRVRSLALIFAADHHPLIVPRIRRYLDERLHVSKNDQVEWVCYWLREGLVQGEGRLADDPATGRFCHGDQPTIADLCLMSQVMAARVFGVDAEDLPTVSRIAEACLALTAFADAQPLRQPGAPAAA